MPPRLRRPSLKGSKRRARAKSSAARFPRLSCRPSKGEAFGSSHSSAAMSRTSSRGTWKALSRRKGFIWRAADRADTGLRDAAEERADSAVDDHDGIREETRRFDMPRGDGTGPNGMGPMSGGAHGRCAGSGAPGFRGIVRTRGDGGFRGAGSPGRGRRHGHRNVFLATGLTGRQRAAAGPGGMRS